MTILSTRTSSTRQLNPETNLTLQGQVGGDFQVGGDLLLTTAHFRFATQYVPLPYPRLRGRNVY